MSQFELKSWIRSISLISLFLLSLTFVFVLLIKIEALTYESSTNASYRAEWDSIRTIIKSGYIDASQKANMTLNRIKEVVREDYPDPKTLAQDLKSVNPSAIRTAFENSTKDLYTFDIKSDANDGFISDDYGVRYDPSGDCASLGQERTWKNEINLHYNQELADKEIQFIKHRPTTNPYTLSNWNGWQFRVSKFGIKFNSLDDEYLQSQFISNRGNYKIFESLEFQYVLPVYSNKDLVGIPRILNGTLNSSSSTFLITYGFNLVEIIDGTPQFKNLTTSYVYERSKLDNDHLLFQFVLLFGGVVIVIAFFFTFFLISNTVVQDREENKVEEKSRN